MYYVNRMQIDMRLDQLPSIVDVLEQAAQRSTEDILHRFAGERALHLAIEVVTDIGSYLIDGFIMRDASSYEDIVEIIREEQVIDTETFEMLHDLVKQRRPLVQDYHIPASQHTLDLPRLSIALQQFAVQVRRYLEKELADF